MYASLNPLAGAPALSNLGLVLDATPRLSPGEFITAMDPWWGCGEFIYARAAGSIRQFGVCVLTPVFDSTLNSWRYDATEVPNTANLGRPLAVSMMVITSGVYGWFCISGLVPVNCSASVAADTSFGIAAAGQGGAVAAGKQILNARVMAAGATTVAKANCTTNGLSVLLQVPNSDGWFPGAYLSGTGIAATATVASVDPSGRFVTMSLASTATVAGTVTATYNNATVFYNVAHLNRPFAQGAIT
jgi:hypothetical protein